MLRTSGRLYRYSLLLLILLGLYDSASDTRIEHRGLLEEAGAESIPIASGSAHEYQVSLRSGDYLALELHQEEIDLILWLMSPEKEPIFKVDGLALQLGVERLWWIAPEAGRYWVVVSVGVSAPNGAYRLKRVHRKPSGTGDRDNVVAFLAFDRACRALGPGGGASNPATLLAQVRQNCKQQPGLVADFLVALARFQLDRGNAAEAMPFYREAFCLYQNLGNRCKAAMTARDLALACEAEGLVADTDKAFIMAEQAAERCKPWLKSKIYQEHGWFLGTRGRFQQALDRYQRALALARVARDRGLEASALEDIGYFYNISGRHQAARELTELVVVIWRELKRTDRLFRANTEIGWSYFWEGRKALAISHLRENIAGASRKVGAIGAGGRWDRLGSAYRMAGRYKEAELAYDKALHLLPDESPDRADVWCNRAELRLKVGDPQGAIDAAQRSLDGFEGNTLKAIHANFILASAQRALGSRDQALASMTEVVTEINQLRQDITDPTLGRDFIDTYAFYLDLYLDLMIQTYSEHPELNSHQVAWSLVDLVRARGLEELVAVKTGELVGEEANQPDPIDLAAIREELLDDGTVLLAYWLAPDHGYLWGISTNEFKFFSLQGKETLAALISDFQLVASEPAKSEQFALLAKHLSDALLGPAKDFIAGKNLLVVKDETLQGLPFGALADPADGAPLISGHSISFLPSAGFGVQLKRWLKHRKSPPLDLAVFADPVYRADDPRLNNRASSMPTPTFLTDPAEPAAPFRNLPRLLHSRQEALSLLHHSSGDRSLAAFGSAASLPGVRAIDLGQYRVLHFAAHGTLRLDMGEDSGIVLSVYDENGNPREGFLSARELAAMNLPVEMTTLSACRTGIGEPFRGEGPWGLVQSLLSAGCARVVVSLWNVDDRATAELMADFYEGLFQRGLTPPEALQKAQLAMIARGKAAPFFWAGFEIHGDSSAFSLGKNTPD